MVNLPCWGHCFGSTVDLIDFISRPWASYSFAVIVVPYLQIDPSEQQECRRNRKVACSAFIVISAIALTSFANDGLDGLEHSPPFFTFSFGGIIQF
jgi:hypothetical protein